LILWRFTVLSFGATSSSTPLLKEDFTFSALMSQGRLSVREKLPSDIS
jgi:hypothetical protein